MTDTNLIQNIKMLPFGFNTKDIMLMLAEAEMNPKDVPLKKDIPEVATWVAKAKNEMATSFIQEGQLRDLLGNMAAEITTLQDINIAIDAAIKAGAKATSRHKTLQEQATSYNHSRINHLKTLDDSHKEQVTPRVEMVDSLSPAPNPKDFMRESKPFNDQMQRLQQTKSNREKFKKEVEQLYKQIKSSQKEALIEYRSVHNPDDLTQVHPSIFEGVKQAPGIITPEKAKAPTTTGPAGGQTPTPTS